MSGGLHTTIERLAQRLMRRWVPKWHAAFFDPDTGGFHERLGEAFQPIPTGRRRLLTQCRQLALYAHAQADGAYGCSALSQSFAYIVDSFSVPGVAGGWRFSVDEKNAPLDDTYDLYAYAFVIFAFSHYFRATGDEQARVLACGALDFIEARFRIPGLPGLAEALDPAYAPVPDLPRRHESHMHLMEACLFAAQIWSDDPAWRARAEEMAGLFTEYFYDAPLNRLSEYYTSALAPAPRARQIVLEPGHYCEWIWLLKKLAALTEEPARYDALCLPMLEWASTAGWDEVYGGIYDELAPDGTVIADTKRLWPFTEALKANALMLDCGADKDRIKRRVKTMVGVFDRHYMQERGFWTEWLNRDLSPATDYMPGTTPYHLYFGIMETRAVLRARGRWGSWRAVPLALYALRRRLSAGARGMKGR